VSRTIIKKLQAADIGLLKVAVQNEDTDPNNLLGRPNGYISRASADLVAGDKAADGTVPGAVFSARHAGLRSGGMGTVSDDIERCESTEEDRW
jgi:hypothetical protein